MVSEADWGLAYKSGGGWGACVATALQSFGTRSSLTPLFIWKSLALGELTSLLLTQNLIKIVGDLMIGKVDAT